MPRTAQRARGQAPERKIVLLRLRAHIREGGRQKCTAIFCVTLAAWRQSVLLDAPELAKRTVAKSDPPIQQCPVGTARSLHTFRQRAIKSRVAAGYIFSEGIERAPERLPHLRRFDMLRFGYQHAAEHEVGDMGESFGGPCA